MTKLRVAFRNSANAPKINCVLLVGNTVVYDGMLRVCQKFTDVATVLQKTESVAAQ
jgi:hypothetical protein